MTMSRADSRAPAATGSQTPMYALVFGVLHAHIAEGRLPPGLVLRERAIARAFGVERAPAAAALRKLEHAGLARKRRGRGYLVTASGRDAPARELPLDVAGLEIDRDTRDALAKRNWRHRIYPQVEREVAACLAFGRFRINQSALGEHHGVSRTIAHEVLTGLERIGLARHERNARWYAGPLTLDDLRASYEMRWLLEPAALRQSAAALDRAALERARARIARAQGRRKPKPEALNELELELHDKLVLGGASALMRGVLRRCQLPIIASYHTVVRDSGGWASGVPETLDEHRHVLEQLIAGRVDAAARTLERHIRHGYELSEPHFRSPPPLPLQAVPSYMVGVD